jgi:hypothetical protein
VRGWRAARISVPWLALSGGTGCGKSVAAAWMVADCGGMWVRAERLVRVFAASFGDQFEEQEQIRDCAFLVLDDIGSELDAARMTSVLIELLDSRKSRRQATLLTTNLGRPQFKDRYGNERLLSRLHESVQWEPISGTDFGGRSELQLQLTGRSVAVCPVSGHCQRIAPHATATRGTCGPGYSCYARRVPEAAE